MERGAVRTSVIARAISALLLSACVIGLLTPAAAPALENRTPAPGGIIRLDLASGESATFPSNTSLEAGQDGSLTLIGLGGSTATWTFKDHDRLRLQAPIQTVKNTGGSIIQLYVEYPGCR